MSDPFVAEIRIFAGDFAPRYWAFCDGQLLPIAQYTALFSLLGTTYGGDGRTNFGLPDLRGRAPMHPGRGPGLTSRRLGERSGVETVTLTTAQIASHDHALRLQRSKPAVSAGPAPGHCVGDTAGPTRHSVSSDVAMAPLSSTGSGQAHDNMQPYLALNFIIATAGIYPSRT